jgi:hypothetical protein
MCPRLFTGAPGFVVALALLVAPRAASADDSAYCRKVQARAASDSALLMAPSLIAQGIRFPGTGQIDLGPTVGRGFQARAGVAFSPLDFYRGLRTLQASSADCAQHDAFIAVEQVVANGQEAARLAALRAQAAFLEAHHDEWQALAARAQERLSLRVITLVQFDDVRRQAEALEHKLVQVHGAVRDLEARNRDFPHGSLRALTEQYFDRASALENETSRIRSLDSWQFRVSGGIIPEPPVDWYGLAELSFDLGAFSRNHQEAKYVEARDDELRHAPYDVGTQVGVFRAQLEAGLEQARRELEVTDREVAFLARTRSVLEGSDAQNVAQERDTLVIEELSIQSEQVFSKSLVVALSAFLGSADG